MAFSEQRQVANVRERKRTEKLNKAFRHLQSIIPKEPSDKMSKIHTLKLTLDYINFLNDILKDEEKAAASVGQTAECSIDGASARLEGDRSSSTNLSSPCGYTSCYPSNQLSPTTGDSYVDDCEPRAAKRRRLSGDEVTDQPISPTTIGPAATVFHRSTEPHNELALALQTSRTYTSYANTFTYPPADRTDDCAPPQNSSVSSGASSCGGMYSPHHESLRDSAPHTTIDGTSLLLRNAFREYRLTKRKIRFFRDPIEDHHHQK